MSGASGMVERVVVIHGPADPATTAVLTAAGLAVAARVGDTTIWTPARLAPPDPSPSVGERTEPGRLLTIDQTAAALGVGRTTTRKLVRTGQLEAVRVGRCVRVPADAVDELVGRLRRRRRDPRRQPGRPQPRRRTDTPGAAVASDSGRPPSQAGGSLEVLGLTDASQRAAAAPGSAHPSAPSEEETCEPDPRPVAS